MMKLTRSSVVMDYRLNANFESIRKRLLATGEEDRLSKPLAYWVLPNDRRLPLAFMSRSLKELIETPFEDLYATPGVGHKKISSLVDLLERAVSAELPGEDRAVNRFAPADSLAVAQRADGEVDLSLVSEAVWVEWREIVVRHGLTSQPLGRFAPSLVNLPRVVWRVPLGAYTDLTLAQVRALKTHGEKRVRAVLEIFGSLERMLRNLDIQPYLAVQIVPRFVRRLEGWLQNALLSDALPPRAEVLEQFVEPLVAEIRNDTGEQICSLAERRLGIAGEPVSVRELALQLGLTRARVYQLLAEIEAAMSVRWPDGSPFVHEVCQRFPASTGDGAALLHATAELCFGAPRRAAEDESPSDGEAATAASQSLREAW